MIRRPPRITRSNTLIPSTTRFRAARTKERTLLEAVHYPLRSVVKKQAPYRRPMKDCLPLQNRRVGQGPLHDDAAIGDDGHLVGEVGDVYCAARRMHRDDLFQPAQADRKSVVWGKSGDIR